MALKSTSCSILPHRGSRSIVGLSQAIFDPAHTSFRSLARTQSFQWACSPQYVHRDRHSRPARAPVHAPAHRCETLLRDARLFGDAKCGVARVWRVRHCEGVRSHASLGRAHTRLPLSSATWAHFCISGNRPRAVANLRQREGHWQPTSV